jgi:hypothetical protein
MHIVGWQTEGNVSLSGLLKLNDGKFLRKQGNLIDYIEWK